eukprot:maker-scaffold1716_size30199-snap-gene-0.10 protein:Tk10402 transcript:maker-scaffold1716_size30199-snap-gene-0.10-mRNA-1 annotation:"hypothetical protein DAPPUDRAFT_303765"
MEPVIVVHGGAGDISDSRVIQKLIGMKAAVRAGYSVLEANQEPINATVASEAVAAAVRIMEDLEAFNAGYGSVLNENGTVEMDAGIMEGKNLGYGAVGGIVRVKHAIDVAAKVMTNSEHCFFVGLGANQFATREGIEEVSEDTLRSPSAVKALERFRNDENITNEIDDHVKGYRGTVGAVAVDAAGNVAAATSTGGLTGKLLGRVGDTPVIGAGVYADNQVGAVSTTGLGESFLRTLMAKRIADQIEAGVAAEEAIRRSLDYMSTRVGGDGGAIAVSPKGEVGIEWNSERMGWAYATRGRVHSGCNRDEHFDEL